MLKQLIAVSLVGLPALLSAQVAPPPIQWMHTWGSTGNDQALKVLPTLDGGYLVIGWAGANNGDVTGYHGGPFDAWLLKLDAAGELQWKRVYGGPGNDQIMDAAPTSDGGYIVAGATTSNSGDVSGNHGQYDAWILKLDLNGYLEWQKCYGGSNTDGASAIVVNDDGGYTFSGSTRSTNGDVSGNHGSSDYWVVRLDPAGSIIWQTCLGGTGNDESTGIVKSDDSGYLITGSSGSSDGDIGHPLGMDDIWVVKVSANGGLVWERSLGGSGEDIGYAVCCTAGGRVTVSGVSSWSEGALACNHGGFDGYIGTLDPGGDLVRQQPCLGGSLSDMLLSIAPTPDGGYISAGWTESNNGDITFNHGMSDGWLVRTDSTGNLLWELALGGSLSDGLYTVLRTADGGYVVAGGSSSSDGDLTYNHGGSDLWVVKLGPDPAGIAEVEAKDAFSLAPNPARDVVELRMERLPEGPLHIDLLADDGKHLATLLENSAATAPLELRFSVAHLPPGVYAVQLRAGGHSWVQRLVKR